MATTVLALLNEPDYSLKEYALQTLDAQVNDLWPEIADHIPVIEELHEDGGFHAQKLAALVVSKVYYNLGDLDLALQFALAAGTELDLTEKSEFVDTIISHGIQTYITQRQQEVDGDASGAITDSAGASDGANGSVNAAAGAANAKLTKIVEEMLERCVGSGQVTLALGIALEARRLDLLESQLQSAHDPETLSFVLDAAITQVNNREFKASVLRALSKVVDAVLHTNNDQCWAQYYALATKLSIQLDDSDLAIRLLEECRPESLAYQAAFDLVAVASLDLLDKAASHFRPSGQKHHVRLVRILSGVPTCDYELTFLERNNHADVNVLQATKSALDSRNSIFHSALSFQNALLHLGTTQDNFFRSNTDWLGKATHWAKFTATSALGVIHKGNLTQGRRILEPYITKTGPGVAHVKGGALYGLGLVFAGFGREVVDYLQDTIQEGIAEMSASGADADAVNNTNGTGSTSDDDVLLHGACLGAALAGMQSQNEGLYATLREVLYQDVNIAGGAAGLAMGLVMLGSKNAQAEEEMLQYSRSTAHEKITSSLPLGLAFLNFGKEEASEKLVKEMFADHDPQLRYGACFTLGMAYVGTGNARVAQKLLHTAVSDASDDVRRAAMIQLGFIYCRTPAALPRMVELLSESHNQHVRYGSAIALGIGCAGTGLVAAVDVLEPMLKDPVDFVRQGAMVALAMILVQHTEQSHPRVKAVREHFAKVVRTKNEDALAKFGAALAQSIIDAGGCNTTINLENRHTGNLNVRAIIGLVVFLQYWNWFPLAHFISLAFSPTTLVCVTEDLKIPEFNVESEGAPAKKFVYPAKFEEPSEKAPEQLVTAILSTTLKELRRKHHNQESNPKGRKEAEEKQKQQDSDAEKAEEKKQAEAAAGNRTDFPVSNMGRVVPWQRKFMKFSDSSVFEPVATHHEMSGVVVVSSKPDADTSDIKYVVTQRQTHAVEDEVEEAPLPEPFVIPVESTEENTDEKDEKPAEQSAEQPTEQHNEGHAQEDSTGENAHGNAE